MTNHQKFLETLKFLKDKPKLLLHSCCAPCSSTCLERLVDYFDITIYFYNPNITSKQEFDKRFNEQLRLVSEIYGDKIKVIEAPYNSEDFYTQIKGMESLPEKSARCYKCYSLRLEKTAIYAKESGFNYFTTTLSLSPHKNADWINEIGEVLSKKYAVNFLNSDFKKENGYMRSIELSKIYNLYRQDYCGCEFSKK